MSGDNRPVSIATHRTLRSVVLCLLYFAQGFPWGFATVALLSVLSEQGYSKEQTAGVTALAILPWTFKFFWAPLIDSLRVPALGLRRPWIVFAQLGMSLTLLGVWATNDLDGDSTITFLAWVFFAHNCFASLQDVATDALAVDLLDDTERGRVNGMMWGSKLFGIAVGGAGMGAVIAHSSLGTAVLVQSLAILAIMLVVIAVKERPGEKRLPWSQGSAQADPNLSVAGGVIGVSKELFRALSLRTTFLAVLMAMTVSLCEGLYVPLTTDLFVQKFEWGAEKFSRNQGTYGVLGEVLGALLGGLLCDRFGRRRMAGLGLVCTSATLLTFGLTSAYWYESGYPAVWLLPLFKGFFALTTVSLFSLYMKISWTGAAACQFTLYMAMSNVGHALGAKLNSLNSWIEKAAQRGWSSLDGVVLADQHFYLVAGYLALVPLFFLVFLRPDTVVAQKLSETPIASSAPEG